MTQQSPTQAHATSTASVTASGGSASGARLVSSRGRSLPLESTELVCQAGGGFARSTLVQRFRNVEQEPLEVTYLLPLPSDGAVGGYSFELQGVTTRGVVEPVELSRERYERALVEGRSAALLEEERSSVFRQRLGNVPPGQHIDIRVVIDHPLSWRGPGWELRFPTVVAPRYQGAQSSGASSVPVTLDDDAEGAAHAVRLSIDDELTAPPSSPSHALSCAQAARATEVRIEGARLDRDVVVRWGVSEAAPAARIETARLPAAHRRNDSHFGLLTLVPPVRPGRSVERDLIVLLDTSGSMAGEPLAQAVRLVSALVSSLGAEDRLELIEFGTSARRWQPEPVAATAVHQQSALGWLRRLQAGGGTEMKSGIDAALSPLREGALRQVVLVSDGLIGFEREILQHLLRRLPRSCRLHTVGVGHGTNRSLLEPAARAGRGVEVIVTPGEAVEPACELLLARTAQPVVVNLSFGGTALAQAPERASDLYAGAPALVPVQLLPGGGTLEIAGETAEGPFFKQLSVPARESGTGSERVLSLYARQRVADAELELAAGTREASAIECEIEALGVDFQISTRLTSWLAVTEADTVDPRLSTKRIEQPHLLAAGVSAEGLGLRSARWFATAAATPAGALLESETLRGVLAEPADAAVRPHRARAPSFDVISHGMPSSLPQAPARRLGFAASTVGAAPPPSAPVAGAPPLELRGKVRLNDGMLLVVSIVFESAGAWSTPLGVTVELADGSLLELELETDNTTLEGIIAAGAEARIVCHLPGKLSGLPHVLHVAAATPARVLLEG